MRRLVALAAWLAAIAASLAVVAPPAAAVSGLDSAYRFESAFLSLHPGDSAQFSVFFDNTGTITWVVGGSTQVNLAVCRADKVTCAVPGDKTAWDPGSWISSRVYATHAKTVVAPGDFSAFTYTIKAPNDVPLGTYRFNGDLVLASSGQLVHPQGYYQDASVSAVVIPPGAAAPTSLQSFVGNYNSGTSNDDVRLTFVAPAGNTIDTYEVQRASGACPITPASSAFATIIPVTLPAGAFGDVKDLDRPAGSYCYQVRTTEPSTGAHAYSNQTGVTITLVADTTRPWITSAVLNDNGGASNALDAPDSFVLSFSEIVTVAPNARLRVTDADCGPPGSPNSGPALCGVNQVQTQADILCGTNATCFLSFDKRSVTVTMTSGPSIVVEGSAFGAQYPVVITESAGIADPSGNTLDLALSNDRTFGPAGQ